MVGWLALLVAAPPVGVVQMAGSEARQIRSGVEAPVTGGSWVFENDVVRSGSSGWVEVGLTGRTRLRVAAASSVKFTSTGVEVVRGRVWLVRRGAASPIRVAAGDLRVRMIGQGSMAVEVHRTLGDWVAVASGEAHVDVHDVHAVLSKGQEASLLPGERVLQGPRPGGRAVFSLLRQTAQARTGATARIQADLLRRVAEVRPSSAREGAPSRRMQLRAGPEVIGADGGPAGALLEESLRPPPFFPDEIPPKGPNVRVEVDFED